MLLHKNRLLLSMLLFVLLWASLIVCVKAEASMWVQSYGGSTYFQEAFSLIETSDGGYALAGYTYSTGMLDDFWLVKTNVDGDMEWNQTYGKSGEYCECATSLVETSDGGYALAGLTALVDEDTDVWLVKTDEFGNVEWNQTYGGEQNDAAYSLVETADGGYIIAGMYNCSENNMWYFWPSGDRAAFFSVGGDGWLVKVDVSGNMEWNQTYGDWDNKWASFYSLVETADGGYAVAGRNDDRDGWLVKVDADGNMEWNKTYVESYYLWAFYSLVETADGGFALAGVRDTPFVDTNEDFWLVKTNSSGDVEWDQVYGGTGDDLAFALVEASDGGYVLAGICDFYENNLIGYMEYTGSFWIVKADEYGVMEWNHTYGGMGPYDFDWAYSLVATSDGGYAVAGATCSYNLTYNRDFWLVKTDEFGVVPEAAWVVLPLLVTATLVILISKKKLLTPCSKGK